MLYLFQLRLLIILNELGYLSHIIAINRSCSRMSFGILLGSGGRLSVGMGGRLYRG